MKGDGEGDKGKLVTKDSEGFGVSDNMRFSNFESSLIIRFVQIF